MTAAHPLFAVAQADFRERTRRYSFLLTLLFAMFLGYATATGKILLALDEYRGVYTSGWIGTLVAQVVTCFVTLVGFYIIKNSVERDRATGVGQILAATPLPKTSYAFGKFLSNFAVMASMVGVLAIAALIMQFFAAEDPHVDLWALLSPFFLLALPTVALTAAVALLFEMVPLLRGGLGNIVWFFAWTFGLSLPLITGKHWMDPFGLFRVVDSLSGEAHRYVPGYHGGLSFTVASLERVKVAQDLRWAGIPWTVASAGERLAWFLVAVIITLFAALVFDRFDSFKAAAAPSTAAPVPQKQIAPSSNASPTSAHLTALNPSARADSFFPLLLAELRLALQGYRWWWYVVALALVIAQAASPLAVSYGPLLGFSWIWPALVWSAMGSRESKHDVRQLLFSCPRILPRQFLACWFAGFAVSMLTSGGVILRLALAAEWPSLVALLAGAVFIPSLALALGILSGSSKFFEGLYTLLWYIGPMNHTPVFDFTGSSDQSQPFAFALRYFVFSFALLASAYLYRSRQLRGN